MIDVTGIKLGRGHAAVMKRDSHPHIKELGQFKIGDIVRVTNGHYEEGSYDKGIIRGFWNHGPAAEVHQAGAIVRFYTRDLNPDKAHWVGDGTPAFEDGGYSLDCLEKVS